MCPVFIRAKEVAFMRRTEELQEYRKMRFEQVYTGWKSKELNQEQAAHWRALLDEVLSVTCAKTMLKRR